MKADRPTTRNLERNRRFYDRWRSFYDLFTRRLFRLQRPRARAIEALSIEHGDRIVEFGCGTGPNIPPLQAVMANRTDCRYVGLDLARGALERAQSHAGEAGHPAFIQADARTPPITPPIDGILSTFVVTIFPQPDAVIDRWFSLLGDGGKLVLLNAHPTDTSGYRLLNPLFNLFLLTANPIDRRRILDQRPWQLLADRIEAIETAIEARASSVHREAFLGGFVSLIAAER